MRVGNDTYGTGGDLVPVKKRAVVNPNYLANSGYDITLLELTLRVDQDAYEGHRLDRDRGPVGARHERDHRRLGRDQLEGGNTPNRLQEAKRPDHDRRLLLRRVLRLRRAGR